MNRSAYSEKLRDPRWQRKRLEKLQRCDFTCEICGDSESPLNVHHKAYFKGRDPWEYDLDQLVVLCESCHEAEHAGGPDILADVVSRFHLDGPHCRRDVGIMLASMFFPHIETDDDYTSGMLRILRESGAQELFEKWEEIYERAIHQKSQEMRKGEA